MSSFLLQEQAIADFLHPIKVVAPKRSISDALRSYVSAIGVGLSVAILCFGIIALPSYIEAQRVTSLEAVSPAPAAEQVAQDIPAAKPETPQATPVPAVVPELPELPENTVFIPSLGVSAPTTWDTPFDEKLMQKSLLGGLAHFSGTARPGETGLVGITGHSSNYRWVQSDFNEIFAGLDQLVAGDEVYTRYNGVTYKYIVARSLVVPPERVDILSAQPSDPFGMVLITCTPRGTSKNRLAVTAHQVYPDPTGNTPFTAANFQLPIPAAR